MNLKFRIQDGDTVTKTETSLVIEHAVFKDNLINSKDAKVQLFVRKDNTSGIIELSKKEWKEIAGLFDKKKEVTVQNQS